MLVAAAVVATVGMMPASSPLDAPRAGSGTAAEVSTPRSSQVRRATVPLASSAGPILEDRAVEAPAVFDVPPAAAASPPTALRSPVAKAAGVWAVVVGINDYPGSRSDLQVAVADAVEVDHALAGYGVPSERRLVLRDTQATAAVIQESLQWLVDRAAADATVVLFYAGHVRKLGAGSEAIVAADGRLVRDSTVAALLRPLQARAAWITIAACYGGGFTEILAPGRILTAAADADQLAYENPSMGRSYLAEYMIRQAMVDGHAPDSVEGAFAWAAERLHAEYPDRVPVQYDHLDGDLQLGPVPAPADTPPAEPSEPADPEPIPATPPVDEPDDDGCFVNLGTVVGCGENGRG